MKKGIISFLMISLFLSGCRQQIVLEPALSQTEEQGSAAVQKDPESETSHHDGNENVSGPDQQKTEDKISVFVCGAVNAPGVYALKKDSRAVDAVNAAGGFSAEADTEWCNLARPVNDGEKLVIYTVQETAQMSDSGQQPEGIVQPGDGGASSSGLININSADASLLIKLPGIGQSKADAIIAYRKSHGPFASVEDIMLVPGIKESVFSQIQDKITV